MSKIGDTLEGLTKRIEARRGDDPSTSYTARLLSEGKARCAKKMGEEAVETALAGALGDKEELAAESADLLYHLAVLLEANGIGFDEVAQELEKRAGTSGIAEKDSRNR